MAKSFFRDRQGGFYDGYRRYKDDEKAMLTRVIGYCPGAEIFDIAITERFEAYYKALVELGYRDIAERGFEGKGKEFSYIVTMTGDCVSITIRTTRENFIHIRSSRYLLDTDSGRDFLTFYRTLKAQKLKRCYTMTNATSASFQAHIGREYKALFPDCSKAKTFGQETAYDFFRDGYRGGWCYLQEEHDSPSDGHVYDINSLYPYIFSRLPMPVGMVHYDTGAPTDRLIAGAREGKIFLMMRVEAKFSLKKDFLPFITPHRNDAPQVEGCEVLYLTLPEYNLFMTHYKAELKHIDYIYMQAMRGVDRGYVNLIYREKSTSEGVRRQIAKNKLNYLIGGFSRKRTRTNLIRVGERWKAVQRTLEIPSQIYIGCAVTSYARCKIVQCAQKNYDKFIYSDTDSLHLTGEATGISVGDGLGQFKHEAHFTEGRYLKRKWYGYTTTTEGHHLTLAGVPTDIQEGISEKFYDHPISDIVEHVGEYAKLL